MTLSIYELESSQEGNANKSHLIDISSAMVTMTVSFVFCAFFVSSALSGTLHGWLFLFLAILKAVLLVGIMVLSATIISYLFDKAFIRRINAMSFGMVMAFVLVFFNL